MLEEDYHIICKFMGMRSHLILLMNASLNLRLDSNACGCLSLHDALPIFPMPTADGLALFDAARRAPYSLVLPASTVRSEEHTSELQSRRDHVCRLLLEKKKICAYIRMHVDAIVYNMEPKSYKRKAVAKCK